MAGIDTPILREKLLERLDADHAKMVGPVEDPASPGGWHSLWITLPSGHLARIENIDSWGVIVEDAEGSPWRGLTFTDASGAVLDASSPDDVVAATIEALTELRRLDRTGDLDSYGVNLQ